MSLCNCSLNIGNTGLPSKLNLLDVAQGLIFTPQFASDGTKNQILASDTIDEAYITDKLNEPDLSKRWYPVQQFKNVEDVRADNITESLNDGTTLFVRKGPRTFLGLLLQADPVYLGKLESIFCQNAAVYFIDDCGKLYGSKNSDGTALNPVRIESQTFSANLIKATDTTTSKLSVSFTVAKTEKDSDLRIIDCSEIEGISLLDIQGLLDVNAAISAESTTGFVAALTLDYGTLKNPLKAEGWLLADFDLYNVTQDAAIVITSVTESPAAIYTFVIPAATSADILRLNGAKEGFELVETLITVP